MTAMIMDYCRPEDLPRLRLTCRAFDNAFINYPVAIAKRMMRNHDVFPGEISCIDFGGTIPLHVRVQASMVKAVRDISIYDQLVAEYYDSLLMAGGRHIDLDDIDMSQFSPTAMRIVFWSWALERAYQDKDNPELRRRKAAICGSSFSISTLEKFETAVARYLAFDVGWLCHCKYSHSSTLLHDDVTNAKLSEMDDWKYKIFASRMEPRMLLELLALYEIFWVQIHYWATGAINEKDYGTSMEQAWLDYRSWGHGGSEVFARVFLAMMEEYPGQSVASVVESSTRKIRERVRCLFDEHIPHWRSVYRCQLNRWENEVKED
ncbi:hypothetical protein ABW19_dt0207965 [Dactylella cylindrospora]|nr:hypothetical protein ABW19_dt0207965 [Dactylella cylindrospora]